MKFNIGDRVYFTEDSVFAKVTEISTDIEIETEDCTTSCLENELCLVSDYKLDTEYPMDDFMKRFLGNNNAIRLVDDIIISQDMEYCPSYLVVSKSWADSLISVSKIRKVGHDTEYIRFEKFKNTEKIIGRRG